MTASNILRIRDGLLLRPWEFGDEGALVKHGNDTEVSKWMRDRFPSPYTMDDAHGWVLMNQSLSPTTNFAIELNGSPVGGAGIVLGEDIHRFGAEVGYWLGRSVWGQGIASAALTALTQYGFERLLLVRLYACVFAGNSASVRVLEKCGFQYEGTRRKAAFKNGEHIDTLEYALVR